MEIRCLVERKSAPTGSGNSNFVHCWGVCLHRGGGGGL